MGYRDERETTSGGAILAILLGGGLVAALALGAFLLFAVRVRSSHMEAEADAVAEQIAMAKRVALLQQAMASDARASVQRAENAKGITVTVDANGAYSLAGEVKTADELEALLIPFARDNSGGPLVIQAESDAPLEPVFRLIESGKRAGMKRYQLTTDGQP